MSVGCRRHRAAIYSRNIRILTEELITQIIPQIMDIHSLGAIAPELYLLMLTMAQAMKTTNKCNTIRIQDE